MKEKRDTSGLYDRIVMLSKIKYGSVNKMLKACDLSKSTVDNIKNGSMPSSDKLSTIAGALDVSTDYLISGNNQNGGLVKIPRSKSRGIL
jgi:transcriptional regulator with XRE-family HTH domain